MARVSVSNNSCLLAVFAVVFPQRGIWDTRGSIRREERQHDAVFWTSATNVFKGLIVRRKGGSSITRDVFFSRSCSGISSSRTIDEGSEFQSGSCGELFTRSLKEVDKAGAETGTVVQCSFLRRFCPYRSQGGTKLFTSTQ